MPLSYDSISYQSKEIIDYKYDICFIGGFADNGFNEKIKVETLNGPNGDVTIEIKGIKPEDNKIDLKKCNDPLKYFKTLWYFDKYTISMEIRYENQTNH